MVDQSLVIVAQTTHNNNKLFHKKLLCEKAVQIDTNWISEFHGKVIVSRFVSNDKTS